jgi:D-lyxose ketol-isomerase
MKRSLINQIMRDALQFLEASNFKLPPFAHWTPEDWTKHSEADVEEIVRSQMGWDITDFGRGDFARFGLFLFTVRNGIPSSQAQLSGRVPKSYCEKIMVCQENQETPMHCHWNKMEDIICRGGEALIVKLFNCLPDRDALDTTSPVTVFTDGVRRVVPAGGTIALTPGESITLPPKVYHSFWSQKGMCLIGEVSLVNDDDTDNCFAEPIGRFPTIIEDEAPLHLLTKDYGTIKYKPSA